MPEAPNKNNLQKFNFAIEKLLQSPKSLFKFSVEMIQTRKESHRPIEFPGAKNVEKSLKPQASSLKPQASNQVRRFRSLLLESLEQRRVFAVDFNSLAASQIDAPAMSNSSQATYTPFQPPTFDLQQAQSTQSGPISPALSSKVAKAVGLSEQTFAPESTLQSFQNAAPNLNSVQPMLVGSGFGSQPDWSQVSSTKSVGSLQLNNSNSSQQFSSIVTGGFASALMPKQSSSQTAAPVASVLSAEQYRGMQSQTVTGSYCTQDGRVVIVPRLGEGEPPADSSGNGGADDEPFIPQVDVPDLQSANGSLNSFTPSDASGSSTTMTLHGSFTASSLTNPDFDADGINWVHLVITNWIDENTWSFTETLVLSYNLSASDSSSSDDEEDNAGSGGGSGDSSSNNGSGSNGSSSGSGSGSSGGSEDPEDELQVTSNWSSSASATRNGFIMYAFTASRGIASPSAAGVAWSVVISYSDRIHFELSANGGSSYTLGVPAGSGTGGCGTACHDSGNSNSGSNSGGPSGGGDGGDGDGGDTDLPDNFKASANWDFSIGLDAHSNGTFNVSSTPSLAIATGIFGGIDRAISANITYDSGGAVDVGSNWSASSSSGNLQPDHENPGDPCITCGGDSNAGSGGDPNSPPPLNPRGNFIGTGHMSASSGGSTGHTGGRSIGGLGVLGTLNNSKWKNLVGDVHDNFHADAHGDGQAKHGFVFQQDTTVTPVADGTNTTKVIVAYGWDSAGDDTATLDADGSVQLGVKPDGQADTSDSTGKAELDGNGNGNGHDFMRIIASDVTNRAWDRQNQLGPTGEVFNETGHRNFRDYLNYNSYNEGRGRDTFHSAVNGTYQPTANATFKIDASGNSFLRVASDNEFAKHTTAWRSDTPVVWLGNSQGNDAQFTELTNDYTVIGLITATLQSDESVVLSGGAHANDKSKIKYRNHNESTWDTNLASGDSLRDAKFDATGTFDANYNAATDTYSESYSKSGDDEVQVTGHVTHIGPVIVGAVGAIGDDPPGIGAMAKTEYELLLEGIFADYDEDRSGGREGDGEGEYVESEAYPAGLVGEGEPPGVVGSIFLGAYLGLAEAGSAISYPLRWFGADFSRQDAAIDAMWDHLHAPEGTRFQTQCAGNVSAVAVHAVALSSLLGAGVVAGGEGTASTMAEIAPSIADDALINVGKTIRSVINTPNGRSYWFRWGDIKHLRPEQVRTIIGDLAPGGVAEGFQVIRVSQTALSSFTKVPGSCGYSEYIFDGAVKVISQAIK